MSEKRYYEILKIENSAKVEQIHEAYKLLAKSYQHSEDNLLDFIYKMKELNEAYSILSDSDDRAKYDVDDSSVDFYKNQEVEEEDPEQEILIERDEYYEGLSKIKIQSCSAFLEPEDGTNWIRIIGEATTINEKPINNYKVIGFDAYDSNGRLIGTSAESWGKFGRRQTFTGLVEIKPKTAIPTKLKVYPKE